MHRDAPVVVRRGGFLSAVAYGVFGTLTTLIVCAAALGAYALHVADSKVDAVFGAGRSVLTALPELREALPPVMADALNDRRAPAYRESVELRASLAETGDDRYREVVIDATNNGDETITLLAVRVVLVGEGGVPLRSLSTYAATPAMIDEEWRGPILPGSTRRCGVTVYHCPPNAALEAEITDLRVWNGPADPPKPATVD